MALSTTIKNKMLAVTHLKYRPVVELKNEDGTWVDFSDRDPKIPQVRQATQGRRNQVVASIATVTLTNDDNYFDWMDDPDNATTIATFGTLATKFTKGFRGVQVRLSVRMFLPDGTYEDARLGVYRIRTISTSKASGRATLTLWQDVDFLRSMGTTALVDGLRHHENKPVSYLLREVLKRFYTSGVTSSDFTIPDRIYLSTADGEPAFSHWGKPPERDSAGRWRNDVTHKPTALMWSSGDSRFYVGIGDEVWKFDPTTEIWTKIGEFGDDALQVRGLYAWGTYVFVVAWKYDQTSRAVTMKTAYISISAGTLTANSSGNDTTFFSGEFMLRDTYHSGGSGLTDIYMGFLKNCPSIGANMIFGVNMPVPFPAYAHSACGGSFNKYMGLKVVTTGNGLRLEIASGDWETFGTTDDPHGIEVDAPCYIAYGNVATGSATARPEVLVPWGMKPNVAWAPSLATLSGSYLFVLETDGNPLGIRCTGTVSIIGYSNVDGTHHTVSENAQSGAVAPIYDLRFWRNSATIDALYWIDVDWVEEMVNVDYNPVSDCNPPVFRIRRGILSDDGTGKPELTDAARTTLWAAGDDLFATDDSEYAAISCLPYPNNAALEGHIVVMMDLADMGGECFKLFYVDADFTTKTLLAENRFGFGGFCQDTTAERVYFIDRDTGRLCYISYASTPSAYAVLGDGEEPVAQAFFEMPQAEGMVIRTESSKVCLYGMSYPYLPAWAQEGVVWPAGKYYFWKYHPQLTDRVELFEEDRQDGWEALGLLAEAVNHQVGIDPDGVGFFSPIPASTGTVVAEFDLDSAICRWLAVEKDDGLDAIVNRSQFVPYEASVGEAEVTLDLVGYHSNGAQVYFNGQTYSKADNTIERNVTLHCIKGGAIGTALFKYLVHDFQVSTFLREAVSLSSPRQLRLDNNQDLAVGMLVQVGDWDEGAAVTEIQADGDVIIDTDMTTAWPVGTPIIFRSAEHGKWSTEYDTPDDFLADDVFTEIGDTGLWLKFELSDEATTYKFAVGDRIRVYNPGLSLDRSRTKKYFVEDSDSIAQFGASEYNPNNPYISLTLGRALSAGLVASDKGPHHEWKISAPLLLQARPWALIKVKSTEHLPTATSNEEVCYIKQVEHDLAKARTTITARACSAYA